MASPFAFQKKAPPIDPAAAAPGAPSAPPPLPEKGGEPPIMVTCPKCGDSFDVIQALTQQPHDAPSAPSAPSDGDGDAGAPGA